MNKNFESGVEGLRGFAALCVLYTHLLWQKDIDPDYQLNTAWQVFEASQGAVLLFFVLSGYVIGLTNKKSLSSKNFKDYLKRRLIRLLPLYWFAIVLSVIVRPIDSGGAILGNLLFLQNEIPLGVWDIPALEANSNVWTLNYEALYYLLFILIWIAPKAWIIWAGSSILIAVSAWLLPGNWGPLLSCYAMGWLFWIVGYRLSQSPTQTGSTMLPMPVISLLLFWFVTWQEKPLWALFHRVGLNPVNDDIWITFSFIDIIPACVALMLSASGRRPKLTRVIYLTTAAIPVGFMVWKLIRGRLEIWPPEHGLVFCLVALACWFWRPDGKQLWSKLAWVGSISYGLYILQRPVQWFVHDADWLPHGSLTSFLLRLTLAVSLTFLVAWLAERKLQPWIKQRFQAPRSSEL